MLCFYYLLLTSLKVVILLGGFEVFLKEFWFFKNYFFLFEIIWGMVKSVQSSLFPHLGQSRLQCTSIILWPHTSHSTMIFCVFFYIKQALNIPFPFKK